MLSQAGNEGVLEGTLVGAFVLESLGAGEGYGVRSIGVLVGVLVGLFVGVAILSRS